MSYHPADEMLKAYAEGILDDVSAFTVATHLESCPACKEKVSVFEQNLGLALAEQKIESASNDSMFDDMFELIVAKDQEAVTCPLPTRAVEVEVNGRTFKLPRSLSKLADRIGEWKSYGGKVFSAPVAISDTARVNLMYMAEDVSIPQHTHKGLESTLVLHGGFSDEDGHYEVGDFLIRDGEVKHSPATKQGEDCLCLTVLTEPMIFTQGVARVFNMFGRGMYP